MNTNGVVIAIVSPTTNYIEMWTREGLELLNIKSENTADPYKMKIPVAILEAAIGDINTLTIAKKKNQDEQSYETSNNVNNVDVNEHVVESMKAESRLKELEATVKQYVMQCKQSAINGLGN